MHLTPNMFTTIVTLQANAKKIITLNAFDTKYYKKLTLKANSKEIITLKCV